jgi:hypothetical protein
LRSAEIILSPLRTLGSRFRGNDTPVVRPKRYPFPERTNASPPHRGWGAGTQIPVVTPKDGLPFANTVNTVTAAMFPYGAQNVAAFIDVTFFQ